MGIFSTVHNEFFPLTAIGQIHQVQLLKQPFLPHRFIFHSKFHYHLPKSDIVIGVAVGVRLFALFIQVIYSISVIFCFECHQVI